MHVTHAFRVPRPSFAFMSRHKAFEVSDYVKSYFTNINIAIETYETSATICRRKMETQDDSIDLAKLQRDALGLVCDDPAASLALIGLTQTSPGARSISAVPFEICKNY